MAKFRHMAAVILCSLLLSACDEVLYSNLSEGDANEMLSTLLKRGVEAQKVSAGKNGFNIEVAQEDLVRSLEIIKEHSLPRQSYESLGSVFSAQGMISSQTEEQARLSYAISQELANTLSKIDGVLNARVHVVLVQHEQASGVTTPPSAAVFLRHTKDSPVPQMVSDIKDTVAKAVAGLNPDRVAVMTELFQENVLAPKQKIVPFYKKPAGIISIGLISIALLATIGAFVMRLKGLSISIDKKVPKED